MHLPDKRNSSGQALLLVLLSMSVVLVVVLSIVSRSVSDISLTRRGEESERAFSAAEAGIEKALIVGTTASSDLGNGSFFNATVTDISAGASYFNFPQEFVSGESGTIWFVSHDGSGNLTCTGLPCFTGNSMNVCWDKTSHSSAVEVSVYYDTSGNGKAINGDFSDVKVIRAGFDASGNTGNNMFSPALGNCTLGEKNYFSSASINFANMGIACSNSQGCLLSVKIRPLYNTTPQTLGISVTGSLPGQGRMVDSIGTSGDSTRRVQVYQTYGELPSIFDGVLFSPSDIQKQSVN